MNWSTEKEIRVKINGDSYKLVGLLAILEAKDLNKIWKPIDYLMPVFDSSTWL